jgi:hypothetical protein
MRRGGGNSRLGRQRRREKRDAIISRWKANELSMADAAGELVALGMNEQAAWALLEPPVDA